jgi:opacity protein-like surface antigen
MSRARGKLGRWTLALALVLELAISNAARAEDPSPPSPWSFQIVPYLWLAGIGGDINGPRESVSVSAGIGDVLSHLSGGLMVLGEAHYRRWFLFGDFDYAKLDGDGSWGLVAGQPSATLKEFLFTVNGGYRFVDTPSVQVDGMIGTRIFSFDTSLSTSGGLLVPPVSDSRSATWADPIIAGRVILPFDDGKAPWFASLYGDVGGGPNGDLTWQLFGGVGYNFNKTIAGFVGYRYLAIDHSSGRFDYRFDQQGPMLGAAFRF